MFRPMCSAQPRETQVSRLSPTLMRTVCEGPLRAVQDLEKCLEILKEARKDCSKIPRKNGSLLKNVLNCFEPCCASIACEKAIRCPSLHNPRGAPPPRRERGSGSALSLALPAAAESRVCPASLRPSSQQGLMRSLISQRTPSQKQAPGPGLHKSLFSRERVKPASVSRGHRLETGQSSVVGGLCDGPGRGMCRCPRVTRGLLPPVLLGEERWPSDRATVPSFVPRASEPPAPSLPHLRLQKPAPATA